MIVRVVLAVVVASALLAASMPAVREVNQYRADQTVASSADRLEAAVDALERDSDPVPPGVPGARRRVRIEVPDHPTGSALRIEPETPGLEAGSDGEQNGSSGRTTLTYTAAGTDEPIHVLDTNVRVAHDDGVAPRGTVLEVREDTVLTLNYRLVDGRPTVTVARGFKPEDRANHSHVGSAG